MNRRPFFLCFVALAGCGGSSDSGASESDAAIDSAATDADASSTRDAGDASEASIDASIAPKFLDGFFPIGVWSQPKSSFAKWKSRGVNTLVNAESESGTVTIEDWSAAAEAAGLSMIRAPQSDPTKDVGKKLLLAWSHPDEVDLDRADHPASAIAAEYAAWKKIDPARAVFLNVSGGDVWYTDGSNDCNGPGDGTATDDCMPSYLASADWVSNDFYPIAGWIPAQDVSMVGKIVDKLAGWSPTKPQFAFVETSDQGLPWAPDAGGPSADQLRAEVWDEIVHGARGVFYFPDRIGGGSTGQSFSFDATPDDVVAEMTKQNATIAALAPILQGPIDPPSRAVSASAPLEVGWRLDDHGALYVIALNLSSAAASKATVKIGATTASEAEIYGTTTNAAIVGGAIADAFGAYEVKIYVVE